MIKFSYNGYIFHITENVYPPSEDSILLLENIILNPDDIALEIGTGSGFIAIQIAKKVKKILATDISSDALKNAVENAKLNKIHNIEFRLGDLFTPIMNGEKFTVIIFNPPYLPTSECDKINNQLEVAWNGGINGRSVIDKFLFSVKNFLEDAGRIYLIQSSLSGIEETISKLRQENFKTKILARRKYFFEELAVIEAKKQGE
ncbi:MAG: class I SAM-dependent methyltransferase [Candidatus Odinarchaeum yellowstonii]|uniref:Class I SAM-dependent methyltransferase n=1 Tax=Odinarchaeota yellowstonii (strain LCB_4) TaxID=1841599 RepID=A0AAF0IAD0_ODILC|nr:MAG: class I SAM-dependent methyltransferase [Candidatus Odinarchaeum yellowstonii]